MIPRKVRYAGPSLSPRGRQRLARLKAAGLSDRLIGVLWGLRPEEICTLRRRHNIGPANKHKRVWHYMAACETPSRRKLMRQLPAVGLNPAWLIPPQWEDAA